MDFPDHLLNLLPVPSREKVERLLSERDVAVAAYRAASDRTMEARQELANLETTTRHVLSLPGGVSIEVHPARNVADEISGRARREREETETRLRAPVEAARRRLQVATNAQERAAERQSSFAYLEDCHAWLRTIASSGGARFQHYAPKPQKVRDHAAEVAKLHAELGRLAGQWETVEIAPVPAAILRSRALAEIDQVAVSGALSIDPRNRNANPLGLARAISIGQVAVPGDAQPHLMLSGNAGAPIFVNLLRDKLVEEVERIVRELPQAGALTDDEREAAFAKIAAERLEIERQEEALIVAAAAEGRIIDRRRDADPRAILEIAEI